MRTDPPEAADRTDEEVAVLGLPDEPAALRELCVELGRARRSGDELAASVGPALAAVEAKLAAVRPPRRSCAASAC